MKWVRRMGRALPGSSAAQARTAREVEERVSPAVAALFEGMAEARQHAILDLGPADGTSLAVYSPFARWIRFADILGPSNAAEEWAAALDAIPENPEQPYDAIFAWDVLDRFAPQARPALIARLAELANPSARLLFIVADTDARPARSLRFSLTAVDRMRCTDTGEPPPPYRPLLPAQVARTLEPFQVVRAFSTRAGFREYLAVGG